MSLLVAVYFDGIEDDGMKDVTGANRISGVAAAGMFAAGIFAVECLRRKMLYDTVII